MLANEKITMAADCVVDEEKIATCLAVLNVESGEVSFGSRQIDKEACKEHREMVREEQAGFEDFAYKIQDFVKSK